MPDYDLALQDGKDGTVLWMKRRDDNSPGSLAPRLEGNS